MKNTIHDEIGGYLELDEYSENEYHTDAIRLNTGRNCFRYVLKSRNIKKIALPIYNCDVIVNTAREEKVEILFYHIDEHFIYHVEDVPDNVYIYCVNYFGLCTKQIADLYKKHNRLIVDNTQAFFEKPLKNCDTLYTCRKYFGVSDGAYLYTNNALISELPFDKSKDRMNHILGRFEDSADKYFEEYRSNEAYLAQQPISRMSKLTHNLMNAIDYDYVIKKREENYDVLDAYLNSINNLKIHSVTGPYMYPFFIHDGRKVRQKLIENKIYVPVLWPNVLNDCNENETEYIIAQNLLPLPCDQRYSDRDMEHIIICIGAIMGESKE